ncbi:MAG: asparagine--tRNA ligase [Candidatus Aenigmarchaeota archaeon]|nr:asparagine--tRNA ligase [Candidatus Aenigmarchaeota archaeon]
MLDGKAKGKVKIGGWIENLRSSGGVQFFIIRDGSGTIQATIHKDNVNKETFENSENLTQESSVIIEGKVQEDDRAPDGYEIEIEKLKILQIADEYPLGKKEHGIDFLLSNRHLWLRSPSQRSVLKIRTTIIKSAIDFLDDLGFSRVDTPILTPTCCEDSTTLFETKFPGGKAYLAQSGQLYSEAAIASLGQVYCFGPTFRAEKSHTPKHLAEFWMLEPEMAFYDFEDNIGVQEGLITAIVKNTLRKNKRELKILGRDTKKLEKIKPPFPRISYKEAIELLQENDFDIKYLDDFGAPQERFISKQFEKPIIIHRFPTKIKAFYMEPDPKDPKLTLSNDIIAPEGYGEIIGGSQRISDPKVLKKRIQEFGLKKENYEWYLDLRKYGTVPHSGFGMGLERVVMWICDTGNIRQTIPFPRTMGRMEP